MASCNTTLNIWVQMKRGETDRHIDRSQPCEAQREPVCMKSDRGIASSVSRLFWNSCVSNQVQDMDSCEHMNIGKELGDSLADRLCISSNHHDHIDHNVDLLDNDQVNYRNILFSSPGARRMSWTQWLKTMNLEQAAG